MRLFSLLRWVKQSAQEAPARLARELYLDLMKACLTNVIYGDPSVTRGTRRDYDPRLRVEGRDWPVNAHTMVGLKRLDGDLYESTMDALVHPYPKLEAGGYVIIDDYGDIPACRQAVHDYREQHGIAEQIKAVDWTGVFWQKFQ